MNLIKYRTTNTDSTIVLNDVTFIVNAMNITLNNNVRIALSHALKKADIALTCFTFHF